MIYSETKEKSGMCVDGGNVDIHQDPADLAKRVDKAERELHVYRNFFSSIDLDLLKEQQDWLCDQIAVLSPTGDEATRNPEGLENLISSLRETMELAGGIAYETSKKDV